jgi:hypothetical protein
VIALANAPQGCIVEIVDKKCASPRRRDNERAPRLRDIVLLLDETAEELAFVGRDPVDAETRRPCGRSPGLRATAETNLLPRNVPPAPVPDLFSGLRRLWRYAETVVHPAPRCRPAARSPM